MNKKNCIVSVIITTFKRGERLRDALLSVINQNCNVEIIVVDDDPLSTQKELCDKFKQEFDCKLIYIRNKVNLGGAESRNVGVRNSTGEYFCFLDDDDYYLPNKLGDLLGIFDQNPAFDVVFGRIVKKSMFNFKQKESCDTRVLISLFDIPKLHTNSSLIKKECFKKAYFLKELKKFQDTQFHAFLIKEYKCLLYDKYVAVWNDDHEGDQITDMLTSKKIHSSIESYEILYNELKKKNYLSFIYRVKMIFSYYYMFFKHSKLIDTKRFNFIEVMCVYMGKIIK